MASTMGINITARDNTGKAFNSARKHAEGFKKDLGGIGAVAGGIGLASLVSKVTEFGKSSLDAFGNAASGASALQRQFGGSIEDASRLNAAFEMTGLDAATSQKAMKGLAGQLSIAGQQLDAYQSQQAAAALAHKTFNGRLGASASTFARLGVSIRTAEGGTVDMKTALLDTAEQFKNMPAGADKTALAVKLFGKAGLAMLPFLNKGKAGVEELMKSSDKLGTTLSDKDVKAAKASTMAKRELSHAVEGLQITVGRELYPMMTKFAQMLTDNVVPAVRSVLDWMKENKQTVVILAGVIGGLIVAHKAMAIATTLWKDAMLVWQTVQKVGTAIQWAFNAALEANPIGLVVAAIALFIGGIVLLFNKNKAFHDLVLKVWAAIKQYVQGFVDWFVKSALPWLKAAFIVISSVVVALWNTFTNAFGKIQTTVGSVVGWIHDKFNGLLDFFQGLGSTISGIFGSVWSGIKSTFKTMWNGLADILNTGIDGANLIPGVHISHVPHLAAGGVVSRPTLALIGEAGPEAVVPLSAARGGGAMLGGGTVVNVYVQGDTDPAGAARRIGALLDKGIASGTWKPSRLVTR